MRLIRAAGHGQNGNFTLILTIFIGSNKIYLKFFCCIILILNSNNVESSENRLVSHEVSEVESSFKPGKCGCKKASQTVVTHTLPTTRVVKWETPSWVTPFHHPFFNWAPSRCYECCPPPVMVSTFL